MPYVMVPVPAEHEQELMTEILKMSVRDSMLGWNDASLTEFVGKSDAPSVDVLLVISDAIIENRKVSYADVATTLGIAEDEVVDQVVAINQRSTFQQRPYLIMEGPAPAGQRADARSLVIAKEYAVTLRRLLMERKRSGGARP
jgi:hypothetical protein